MAKSDFIAARMRIHPLLPDGLTTENAIKVSLRIARRDLMRRLKRKLSQTSSYSAKAKAAFQKALAIETKPATLVVTINHPAFRPLVYGQKHGSMTWLKKARRPIPIITETGKLIFRSAHARSLTWTQGPMTGPRAGKPPGWRHPGREPASFVDQAKEESRNFIRDKLKNELRSLIRKSLATKRR